MRWPLLASLTNPAHEELLELGRGWVTRPTVRHYLGFARGRRECDGAEKMSLEPAELERHLRALEGLETRLHEADAASRLPEEPTTVPALDGFVVGVPLDRIHKP